MSKFFTMILVALLIGCSDTNHIEEGGYDTSVYLSGPERLYVAEHVVKVGAGDARAPFIMLDVDGTAHGLAVDYLKLIQQKTGLKFEYVKFTDVENGVALFKNQQLDIIPSIPISKEREQLLSFTDPYIVVGTTMLLKGLPVKFPLAVGYGKGYAVESYLERIGLQVKLVPFANDEASFAALLNDELGGVIMTSAQADYLERKYHKKFARSNVEFENEIAIGYQKTNPTLGLILQKGLAAITAEEHDKIQRAWLSEQSLAEQSH